MTYEQWKAGVPERNKAAIGRVKRSAEGPLAAECWAKTLEEVSKGWLSELTPLTDKIAAETALTPRYLITEQHGEQKEKQELSMT